MKLVLKERGRPAVVPRLPDGVGELLSPLVSVSDAGASRSRVSPGARVGVLRVGEVTVHVEPKLPIAQLLFIVDHGRRPVAWKENQAVVEETGELAATVADVFARQAERATARGLLHGYRTVRRAEPVLRGRIRLTDPLATRYAAPFEVSYQEFGADVAENRILRAAGETLLALPRVRPETRASLAKLVRLCAAVSPVQRGQSLPAWTPHRLNAAYHDALRTAALVLRGSAFGPGPGGIAAHGFVLDMERVFEQFVCSALGEAMQTRCAGRWEAPYSTHADNGQVLSIKPDFAFLAGGRVVALADAKYKFGAQKPADVYQMLTYCTALGVRRGHLVYAEGAPSPVVHEIRNTGIRVVRHFLDLTGTQASLLSGIGRLADELAADTAA